MLLQPPWCQCLVAGAQESEGWRFWQPFRGGPAFVATQGLGWALTAAALASVLALGRQIALGVAHAIRAWLLATSAVMLLAQLVREHVKSSEHGLHL